MATSLVYALAEGMNVRYVGYTARPARRQKAHHQAHPTWHWLVLGAYPSAAIGLEQERWWIARLRAKGHPLTNKSDGGDWCPLGVSMSALTKARLSAALTGKKRTPEMIGKLSEAHKGQSPSLETRAKLSLALKGNKNCLGQRPNAETRAKMSASRRGQKHTLGHRHSPETRAKMSAAHRARPPFTEEHRENLRLAWVRRRGDG